MENCLELSLVILLIVNWTQIYREFTELQKLAKTWSRYGRYSSLWGEGKWSPGDVVNGISKGLLCCKARPCCLVHHGGAHSLTMIHYMNVLALPVSWPAMKPLPKRYLPLLWIVLVVVVVDSSSQVISPSFLFHCWGVNRVIYVARQESLQNAGWCSCLFAANKTFPPRRNPI